ncbi:MAG: hypothetical protein KDK59_04805 [Simkania sp.]|nr:hypothetical protein [Simkania sp.]
MNSKLVKYSLGDVYEVQTSKGLAYFQYTHEYTKPPKWGSLIRVLEGFYEKRPSDEKLSEIAKKPHRFQTFCFLRSGIKDGEVNFIGNFPIPEFAQEFPIFKGTNSSPRKPKEEKIWWLWDGEKEWKVGFLSTEEQKMYPLQKLCSISSLIKNIETGKSLAIELC